MRRHAAALGLLFATACTTSEPASTAGAGGRGGAGGSTAGGSGGGAAGQAGGGGGGGGGQSGGGADASSDAAADTRRADPCATARFCDNFDSYTAGAAPRGMWKVSTSNGTLAVDTAHTFSGPNAVHVVNAGTQAYEKAYMSLEGAPFFPLPGNAMYGRMMIYVTQVPADVVHWSILQGEGAVPGMNITWAVTRYGGQYNTRMMANYDSSPLKSDCWKHSQTTIPQNRWACVEWQLDGPNNTMRFWLDGQALADLTVVQKGEGCIAHDTMDNWWAPTFSAIRLGWEHYQQGPGELWIDDVVLDTAPIGCPP